MTGKIKKSFNKVWVSLAVSLCYTLTSQSQTIGFINYNEAQIMYNPAMLSSISRPQVVLNYRNSHLTNDVNSFSSMLGVQVPLGYYFEKLNFGTVCVSVFNDYSNYAPSVKNTGLAFAYSQPVRLTSHSFVSIGLQCNLYQKRLDINSFTTGSQWDSNLGFNSSLSNGEEQFKNQLDQYSLNSGIYWQVDENGKRKIYLGGSLYNINRPNQSFTENIYRQQLRYFVNGGYVFVDNNTGNISLDALYTIQEKQNTAGVGVKAGLYYGTNSSGTGEIAGFARFLSNNTVVAGALLEQNWFTLGVSYDFSTDQEFSAGNRSNSFEAFLKVRWGRSARRKTTTPVVASGYHTGQKRVFAEDRKTEVIESSTSDAVALKKVEAASDTGNVKYEPMKLALKRDFKFGFNDAALSDEAQKYLDELVGLLQRNRRITLEIIGHTDDVGSKEGNLKISLLRAGVVSDYMESKGIDKKRLTIKGKMDSEPLFPNTTPENRARNRRVEFIILN